MSNSVVIYRSKYGSTKKYAEWIAEELSCDIFDRKRIKAVDLERYDTIIYGGGLYVGRVPGIDLIIKSFDKIYNKNIILFTCGLADLTDKNNINNIETKINKVLSPKMQEVIKLFHLRGGIDYSKLGIIHRLMMAMLHLFLAKKDYNTLSNGEKGIINTYGKVIDFTDKETIIPMINYIREL